METKRTIGFVLKTSKIREADKGVVLFSKELGKLFLIGKNASKSIKRFGSSLEPLTKIEALFGISKRTGMLILSEVSAINDYYYLKTDPAKMTAASIMIDCVNSYLPEMLKNERIYELLDKNLTTLSENSDTNLNQLVFNFLSGLINILGISPQISACFNCGKKVDFANHKKFVIEIKAGGIICRNCRSGSPYETVVEREFLLSFSGESNSEDKDWISWNNILAKYLNVHFEATPKSFKFLDSIDFR